MLLSLKLLLIAICFVISGGSFFSRSFHNHRFLVILAGIFTLGGSIYLGKDICEDFGYCQNEVIPIPLPVPDKPWEPIPTKAPPLPPLSAKLKATFFSSIFKFSFEVLSFEAFKKQQAFKKKDMFETTQAYQARYAKLKNIFQDYLQQLANHRQQLIDNYNDAILTANQTYQVGVITLINYNADAGQMSVKLDWQAAWIIDNVMTHKDLIKEATITISPSNAKALWERGQEKRLFFKVTGFNNDKEYLSGKGVLVEVGANRHWEINGSLLHLSPTDKGKKQLLTMKQKGVLVEASLFSDRLFNDSQDYEMVLIPAGSFKMGDIQGGGSSDEKPVHRVSVSAFAIGKYEVTFAEYDKFVQATGRNKPKDRGWGRGNRPVINVSWDDAVAYAKWLSQRTGKKYRLPTEAEWEYAARAGTKTKYWWGNEIGSNKANCRNCGDSFKYTAPVGSFAANQFGIYDTMGNVWEWTCSEYNDKYQGYEKKCKPTASKFVLRGGSWSNNPWRTRSANRYRNRPTERYGDYGFRLVRTP